MPQVIAPSGGTPSVPEDSTLVQIGFSYALNYQFVVDNPLSAAQIFQYLPEGLGYGLSVNLSDITVSSLQPYESSTAGYIVTVAMAYIPSETYSTLDAYIHTPSSILFNPPDASVAALMNLIDPSIPLIPGQTTSATGSTGGGTGSGTGSSGSGGSGSSGSGSGGSGSGGSGSGTSPDSGSIDSGTSTSTPTASSKTAGIAVGVVAGACAYAGAMFLLAKRHQKKKKEGLRLSGSDNGYIGASASQGGSYHDDTSVHSHSLRSSNSNGSRSGRITNILPISQQISQPVMSENSLGWT